MIFTNSLKYGDVVSKLDKEKDTITIVGCNGCVRASGAGGPEKMKELALKLRSDGCNVVDGYMLPVTCVESYIYKAKLSPNVNTVIALTCSAGFFNIKKNFSHVKVVESVEDIGLLVADANTGIIKVVMPYEKHKDKLGEEYIMGSDGKDKVVEKQIPMELEV
ncbi:hypothetical protein [Anaeromicrobium sediminis]|uniref:Uncharacterized protein n=1 Tax=Anaeromicrobium sediminis TaxID=1478221 RepID=A0A267MA98_9FIRM|nr:hypothetical protein [Anaeromicrobium sediminis]PAB56504.1 hypothetical protein CCE28_20765 [Anaeromicrobium sediminis]